MNDFVLGKSITVSVLHDFGSGETYYPLFCAKSMELNIAFDELETVGDSGTDRDFQIGLQSGVLTLVGVTKTKDPPDVDKASPFFLYAIRKTKKSYLLTFTDQDGNVVSFTLNAIMRRLNFAGNATSFNQSTAELRLSGPLVSDAYGYGGGAVCVPVTATGFAPPDGTLTTTYSYTLPLSGTNPKTLGTISGNPGWMTISVGSGNLVLGGTPTSLGDVGTFFLDIVINNPCGSIHLIDEGGATIGEDGKNVFVINNSSVNIDVTNDNGHVYTFLATNGSDGNFKMQSVNVTISLTGTKTYEFLQSLPSTLVNSGTSGSGIITSSNFSNTNYLRFSD